MLEHVSEKILTEFFLPMFKCRIEIILFQHFREVYSFMMVAQQQDQQQKV